MSAPARDARERTETAKDLRNQRTGPSTGAGNRGPQHSPQADLPLTAAQLLTAGQLAERWQVRKEHVYRLTREGRIPAVRLGRYFRYRLDAIERWEEAQTNA